MSILGRRRRTRGTKGAPRRLSRRRARRKAPRSPRHSGRSRGRRPRRGRTAGAPTAVRAVAVLCQNVGVVAQESDVLDRRRTGRCSPEGCFCDSAMRSGRRRRGGVAARDGLVRARAPATSRVGRRCGYRPCRRSPTAPCLKEIAVADELGDEAGGRIGVKLGPVPIWSIRPWLKTAMRSESRSASS